MNEVKYKPLKNNDDDDDNTLHDHPSNNNHNQFPNYNAIRCNQDCKIYWLLKILFLCFIIVKIIYAINNYDTILNWLTKHNETGIEEDFSGNFTILYEQETTVSVNKANTPVTFENKETDQSTTTINANKYYEYTTEKLFYTIDEKDEITKKTEFFNTNYYDNVDLATTIKVAMNTKQTTKIVALETTTTTKTTTTKPTTIVNDLSSNKTTIQYLNETIVKTTLKPMIAQNITDLMLKDLTTTSSQLDLKIVTKNKQKYFINTSHCHIPYVDPFTTEIRKMFKPQHKTGCTTDHAIISVTFNDVISQYVLNINYTVAEILRKSKNPPIEEDLLCCYQEVVRSGSGSNVDNGFKLLPCTNFHQNFTVPFHINGIKVQCKAKQLKQTLQEDAFSFIQVNKTSIQGDNLHKETVNETRTPSVLMFGIDSVSRINFRRNMPQMLKYLTDHEWYELQGYNKVGDNTLPNLMPLLSGYTRPTVYDKCKPNRVGGFDNCNFMWTTFKKNGYYTAYAEDSTTISTFNYHLKGFKKPPTDHYFRPFGLAIEKSLKAKRKAGLNYCLGRRQFGEYVYDYATEFIERYQNLTTFGFFWTNSFSHNSYDIAATMDSTMVKYFKNWEKMGTFEKSVVIFFSDHGVRWGPLLKLSEGFLEERLPMFFISVPKWFKQKYPSLVKNLEINQHRLVTAFDINMTLQHLLKLAKPDYSVYQTYDCKKCQTIFEEIPENRTCNDAAIPETWCTCIPFKTESVKSKTIKAVTQLIVQEMNHYFELKNLTSLCSPLKLKDITMAKKRYTDDSSAMSNLTTYAIDFTTNPLTDPKTLFSATVDYDEKHKSIHLNVEDISRKSLYEKTAKCTDDKQFKKYCICKNSLKT